METRPRDAGASFTRAGTRTTPPAGRCLGELLCVENPSSSVVRSTQRVTRGADGRDACASKRRDRTNRRVDAVVRKRAHHLGTLAAHGLPAVRIASVVAYPV